MKRLIPISLIIFIIVSMLTGCGKTALTDMVDRYEYCGIEDGTILWEVYFNDDYKSSEYDYEDFIDVIKECMSHSGQYVFSNAWILGFDDDGYTNRFSWNTTENPYIIEQTDGTVPNLREYEWNLTVGEVNEIWDSVGNETADDIEIINAATRHAEEVEEPAEEESEQEAPAVEKTLTHDFNEETNQKNEQFYGVGFDVPQTWEKQEVTTEGIRTYMMGNDSLMLTHKDENNYTESYHPYEDEIMSSLKADFNDFTLIDTSEVEIYDGKTALEVNFTWKDGDETYDDTALFFKQFTGLVGFYFQSARSSEYDRSEDIENVIDSLRAWSSDYNG